ncbi:MAG: peroxiredoxin family protein [Acidobacteriia bacterium]|nr:peroxiredoxin family protein [Terriglobia bacterium]
MAQFESQKQKIAKAGVQLVYVAAERRDGFWKPGKFLEKHPVSFPFLLDEDRAVTKEYGLYHAIGFDAFDIAHPATLVIDRSGIVRWIYRGENQTDRAPLEDVLTAVREIGS